MKNSGLAVASLTLGIIGLVLKLIPFLGWIGVICAIVALVLGGIAKSAIKDSNGALGGEGMATAGIVLSIITLVIWVLTWVACAGIISTLS